MYFAIFFKNIIDKVVKINRNFILKDYNFVFNFSFEVI